MQKFIIISQGRAGSTMLRRILNSERRISCHGEVFGENRVLGFTFSNMFPDLPQDASDLKKVRDTLGPSAFTDTYIFPSTVEKHAVGFKMLDWHFEVPKTGPFLVDFIGSHPNVKLIYIYREDQFARFLSFCVKRKHIDPEARKNKVSRRLLKSFMQDAFQRHHAYWTKFPDNHTLYFSYEQLIADFDKSTDVLSDFLGLENGTYKIQEKKSPSRNFRSLVSNYDALEAFYHKHYSDQVRATFPPVFAREKL